jgi:hypothetical protein
MMRHVVYLIFSIALIGCNSLKTNFEFDKATDFSQYQTFAPLRVNDQLRGSISKPIAVGKTIDRAILDGMQARGYRSVTEAPDLHVTYFLSVEETVSEYEPLPYTARGSGSSLRIEPDRRGVLRIDIVDVASNELIWRGTASDAVDREDPDAEQNIRGVINTLLSKFPKRP